MEFNQREQELIKGFMTTLVNCKDCEDACPDAVALGRELLHEDNFVKESYLEKLRQLFVEIYTGSFEDEVKPMFFNSEEIELFDRISGVEKEEYIEADSVLEAITKYCKSDR